MRSQSKQIKLSNKPRSKSFFILTLILYTFRIRLHDPLSNLRIPYYLNGSLFGDAPLVHVQVNRPQSHSQANQPSRQTNKPVKNYSGKQLVGTILDISRTRSKERDLCHPHVITFGDKPIVEYAINLE